MPSIFVSYRREDSAGHTGRIHDDLTEALGPGHVFMDIDTIEPGMDFVEAIEDGIGRCKVLLVVIGRSWLSITDARGRRRLDDPNDFVRLEVATALQRGVKVVPVLVGGAAMPSTADLPEPLQPLARRNAFEVSDHRWKFDLERLAEMVRRLAGLPEPRPKPVPPGPGPKPASPMRPYVVGGVGGAVALLALLVWIGLESQPEPFQPDPPAPYGLYEEPDDPPAPAPVTRVTDPTEQHRAAIVATLQRAGEAEIEASKVLDSTPLRQVYTGGALTGLENDLQIMRNTGVHLAATLHGREVGPLAVTPDGTGARVAVTEYWSAEVHSNYPDVCVGRIPRYPAPKSVSLVQAQGRWMINSMESSAAVPDPVPCY